MIFITNIFSQFLQCFENIFCREYVPCVQLLYCGILLIFVSTVDHYDSSRKAVTNCDHIILNFKRKKNLSWIIVVMRKVTFPLKFPNEGIYTQKQFTAK